MGSLAPGDARCSREPSHRTKKTNSQEMNLLHQLNDGRMNLPAIQGINHRIARVLDGFRGRIVIWDAIDFFDG